MMTPTKYFYQIIDSCLSIFRVLVRIHHFSNVKKTNAQQILSILANGPSLKKEDPKEIKGDKLAVNFFASSEVFHQYQPNYYIFIAPEFWATDVDERTKHLVKKLTNDLVQKVKWPMILFIPKLAGKHFDFLPQKNPNIQIKKITTIPVEGLPSISYFLFNLQLGLPRPHNVLVPSIMLGIWMGYPTIKLYGADHSWLPLIYVDDHNNVLLEQKHFYDEGKTKPRLMRKDAKFKEGRKLHEMLEKFYLSFKAYHILQAYSKKRNVMIYNATPNSFIDAFQRKR